MVNNRTRRNRNNTRRRRVVRRNRRNNMRPIRVFRHPPVVSLRPRTTGYGACGLSTTVVSMVQYSLDVKTDKPKPTDSFLSLTSHVEVIKVTPQYLFNNRHDGAGKLHLIYSEFRVNRIDVWYIPVIPTTAWGNSAIAVVDGGFGTNAAMEYWDVVSAPNSQVARASERMARSWVPTEPDDVNYHVVDQTVCKILLANTQIECPGNGKDATRDKAIVAEIRILANVTVRSPLDNKTVIENFRIHVREFDEAPVVRLLADASME